MLKINEEMLLLLKQCLKSHRPDLLWVLASDTNIDETFSSLEELKRELQDYVHWFNHIRIHGILGYISPVEYKQEQVFKTGISPFPILNYWVIKILLFLGGLIATALGISLFIDLIKTL